LSRGEGEDGLGAESRASAPLAGVRVLDLSESLAGPFCTQILGDMGADVIKVERPGGDAARRWGPPFYEGESAIFLSANRNKRSIALDMKSEAGAEAVRRLVARSDVVVQSFRAGVVESLGLGAEELLEQYPRLVYCSITAFGVRGPMRDVRGYDPLAQAYGGLMSVNGHPGQDPARIGTSVVDMGTGMWAALAIMGALRERDASGKGGHVVVSLLDTALTWMSYHVMGYFAAGVVPGPQGSRLDILAPYEAFPTSDGWAMVNAATDQQFRGLCIALGIAECASDERYASNATRVQHRNALHATIASATAQSSTEELLARLRAAGVPCAPILNVEQVVGLEQVQASGMLLESEDTVKSVALPIEWNGERSEVRHRPPHIGEHTSEILRELGLE
jgi:crotonobetainyl-CoA:carnitine CoA-transferase CaiB-like acyl-CoA transferase